MQQKKSCCHFFRKIFSKPAPQKDSQGKPPQDKTEISISNKTFYTETKPKKPIEPSVIASESEPNSLYYDRNSALVDSVDKKKAVANLDIAFEIINYSEDSCSKSLSYSDQFTKVVKEINFKKILEAEDSIISDQPQA